MFLAILDYLTYDTCFVKKLKLKFTLGSLKLSHPYREGDLEYKIIRWVAQRFFLFDLCIDMKCSNSIFIGSIFITRDR